MLALASINKRHAKLARLAELIDDAHDFAALLRRKLLDRRGAEHLLQLPVHGMLNRLHDGFAREHLNRLGQLARMGKPAKPPPALAISSISVVPNSPDRPDRQCRPH